MIQRSIKTLLVLIAFCLAALAGYRISSSLEQQILKAEAEKQLSTLLHGPVKIKTVHLALRGGLFLEGQDVGTYPSDSAPHEPRLFARRVSAEIDVTALLGGRFRLSGLLLKDVTFRIEHRKDDIWEPSPVEALVEQSRKVHPNPMDQNLGFLTAFEDVTRTLLADVILADRFEVQNGHVIFTDHRPPAKPEGAAPVRMEIKHLNGRIVHHWLSGVVDLRLGATLVGHDQSSIPLRIEGSHNGGGDLQIELAARDLTLNLIEPYLSTEAGPIQLSGAWKGHLFYETGRMDHGELTTEGTFSDLVMKIPVPNGTIESSLEKIFFSAQMRVEPDHAWLEPAVLETQGVTLTLHGDVERPISTESELQLSGYMNGLDLEGLRAVLGSLPDEESKALENFLIRTESGFLKQARGVGQASIQEWERLLSGQDSALPPGFVIAADLYGVDIRTGNDGIIHDLKGSVEVTRNLFSLLDVTGSLNHSPLPTFNVRVHDFTNLMKGPADERKMQVRVPALPGIPTFLQLFRTTEPENEESASSQPDIILRIERLEYPIFSWPIRNAFVRVSALPGGSRFDIKKGLWAGVPFWGGATWTHETSDILDFEVWTSPYEDTSVRERDRNPAEETTQTDDSTDIETVSSWARGRFEIPQFVLAGLDFDNMRGFFRFREQDLELLQVRSEMKPSGKFLGNALFNLGEDEEIETEINLSVVSADVARVGESVGFGSGFATGDLHLSGKLTGTLRPQTPVLADLTGDLNLNASDGELQVNQLPLLVALAQATEGYGENAQRDSIAYESLDGILHVADGRISTSDLELEGPLRIYASGSLDVTRPPNEMIGVVGLFIFRGPGQVMENIPLAKAILPGSEKGLLGAYYQVNGTFDEPEIEPLRSKSISEGMPEVLVAPYALLNAILTGKGVDHGQTEPDPIPAPDPQTPPDSSLESSGKAIEENAEPETGSNQEDTLPRDPESSEGSETVRTPEPPAEASP